VLELPTGTVARAALVEGVRVEIDGEGVPALGADGDAASTERAAMLNAIACNVLLAALYLLFVMAHVAFVRRTGQWTTVAPLVVQESLLVVLFLTRRRSVATSDRPIDWAVGISGVLLPLLMRPTVTASMLAQLGEAMQIVGLSVAAVAVGCLGRSVGVVPANRGIKSAGTYRVVRHPMYAAYLVSYVGYVLTYPSWRNALLTGGTAAALYARAVAEERLLTQDSRYREYLGATRWRFFPYVY
jgi:protein-S-isoprenylcysteine O-methyltransferase Ste14